ncbi:hypothetical protein [Salinicola endophyticus]|uniref:Pectate lyase superfamily protein domain-containing protein n=1 Tax=Salinicola endophyticus TaxID=1949083 RepID=A0AB74U0W8_9GAMM
MSDLKTVIDYGADPSGKQNSAAAFQAMADAADVGTVFVPDGDYVIAQTVDLKGKSMRGLARNRNGGASRLRPAGNIEGPMFTNQGAVISDLHIYGGGEKRGITAFAARGYNGLFHNVRFDQIGTAIDIEEITVHFSVVDCRFIMTGTGLRCRDVNNAVSTTTRFVRNEFNNCGNGVVYDRDLKGPSFIDNIFEYMSGDAIVAALIYNGTFVGNWWEKRRPDGTESPFGNASQADGAGYPCVRTLKSQQMMRCFASSNSMSYGWADVFATDSHVGKMGGVSLNDGDVVVRDSTGRAVRITDTGIFRECAPYAGLGPFVIDANYNSTGRPGMTLRSGGGPIRLEDDAENGFSGALVFDKGEGLEERFTLAKNVRGQRTAGLTGLSDVVVGDETKRAITGIPQHFLWRQDGLSRGLGALQSHEVSQPGVVKFVFPYLIDNPIIQVSVEDRGVRFDGWSYVEGYINNSVTRRQCKGVYLYFTDLEGNAVTPESFAMQILTLEPGID